MVLFDYDKPTRIITIPISYGTELDVQDLLDDIRDYEDEFHAMDIPHIAEASGKQDLGGGVLVGITLTLVDWKVKFEARAGPDYTLCSISGGNLVTYVSSTGTYVTPVEPSAFVTVTLTASSSATLQELDAIQYGSFDGGVWIDQVNGTAGTEYDLGTPANPVDNITNAKSIADTRGFSTFYIVGDLVVESTDDITDYTLVGASQDKTDIYLHYGCVVEGCEFESATISGCLDGAVVNFYDCRLEHHLRCLKNGYMRNCILAGTIHVTGQTGEVVDILSSYSGVPGHNTPIIDFQGTYSNLGLRDYAGGIMLSGMTHPSSEASLDFLSGHGKIDESCISGTVVVRGTAKCTDNSGDGCSVDVTQLRIPESDFQGYVWIDMNGGGVSGTAYPIGTPSQPVNNLGQALTIASEYHIENIHLYGTLTTLGTEDLSDKNIESTSPLLARVNVTPGTITDSTTFKLLTVSGSMTGGVACLDTYVAGLQNYAGAMRDSYLEGNITLLDHYDAVIHNCYTRLEGNESQTISIGSGKLSLENLHGSAILTNKVSGNEAHADFGQGELTIDSTCTSGEIHVAGIVKLTDNSGPNCDVYTEGQIQASPSEFEGSVWINTITGVSGTIFPLGTPTSPVDNFGSAVSIADYHNISKYKVNGTILTKGSENLDNIVFESDSALTGKIYITEGTSLNNTTFHHIGISGSMSGSTHIHDCHLINIRELDGDLYNCDWEGSLSLASGAQVNIVDSQGGSTTGADVYMSGASFASFLRTTDYFTVKNMTHPSAYCSFVGNSAITIDPTVVSGTIDIAGDSVLLADNSGPGATVRSLYSNVSKVWDKLMSSHRTDGTAGYYLSAASAGGGGGTTSAGGAGM